MMARKLSDQYGRVFDYARIAVTERCNLRCVYCMPESGVDFARGARLLSSDEIIRLLQLLAVLGVRKFRFTGGEPLVRRDLLSLVEAAASLSAVEEVHLTTNGVLLGRKLSELAAAGLTGVNISIDTLREDRYRSITRRNGLQEALVALRSAVDVLPVVKVNVVAMRGFNDDEFVDFARLAQQLPITIRFIELMPFDASQVWNSGRFVGTHQIKASLLNVWPELEAVGGTATESWTARIPGGVGKVAVIPAFTRSLCSDCNRIRITADGKLRNCLYSESEYSLREPMRAGVPDEVLLNMLRRGVVEKARDGWAAQRASTSRFRISMTQIGG